MAKKKTKSKQKAPGRSKKSTRKKTTGKASVKASAKGPVKKKGSAPKKSRSAVLKKKTTPKKSHGAKTREPKVLESPDYTGRPTKLPRDTYPEEATAKDFLCFGPPATSDGDFDSVRICDMGCFTQDGKDSNKYYHGAVVQHRKSKNWYTYFEWGRTGASSRSFQFMACQSEQDARALFAKRLKEKNEKRGEWVTIAGIRTLRAKKGKDCYLVRPMATRSTGLPDARNIKSNQRTSSKPVNIRSASSEPEGDPATLKLLRELRIATIGYTKKSMADSSVPTSVAIEQARAILGEAQSRVAEFADDIEGQIHDKKLMQLTELMFGRIPRRKRVGAPISTWILSSKNIQGWHDDLDAFESALHAVDIELKPDADILAEMNLSMTWVEPDSKLGQFLYGWCPKASVKNHQKINAMEIVNIWEVDQHSTKQVIEKGQKRILRSRFEIKAKPRHQPKTRIDVPTTKRSDFKRSNTAFLFHGTRGVNVSAILRESLRLPETLVAVPITGAKFGPGIYFSDDWKKAADYTNAKGSAEVGRQGSVRGRHAFMFVADVILGQPYVAPSIQGYAKPPRGHHSVFAKAEHTGVDDNEFIVFKTDQNRLRYLIEFKTT